MALFYDTDREGFDGTLIEGCLPPSPGACDPITGACAWDTTTYGPWSTPSSFPPRFYWIYACAFDGESVYCDYADNRVLFL